ncbi:MAG: hypothetical protein ACRDV9_10275 [Acidimicrobiia bacterium]
MKKLLGGMLAPSALLGVVACDDAAKDGTTIDEDDGRLGPGDGNDEFGPGR